MTTSCDNLHNSLLDFRVRAHAQIVVRAPNGDLFPVYVELRRERRINGASCDFLEDAIRMILFLFHDLLHEKSRVLEAFFLVERFG